MAELFNTALYEPLFNLMMFFYKAIPGNDMGVAIIVVTLIIKSILFLPSLSSIKSQKAIQEIQPKIDEIKKKYKDDKQKQSQELMRVYKENKVNPFSSCLPLLIQLPILIALFRVFMGGLNLDPETGTLVADQLQHLYGPLRDYFANTSISPLLFNWVDLSQPFWLFAILAGAFQFWQTKMLQLRRKVPKVPGAKDEGMAASMNKQMVYFMPLITVFFGFTFPAGLTLYWMFSTLFMVGQQYFYLGRKDKKEDKSQVQVLPKKDEPKKKTTD